MEMEKPKKMRRDRSEADQLIGESLAEAARLLGISTFGGV
jgi:hypothetical protein